MLDSPSRYPDVCEDCTYLLDASNRVLRGRRFSNDRVQGHLRAAGRFDWSSTQPTDTRGVRWARPDP